MQQGLSFQASTSNHRRHDPSAGWLRRLWSTIGEAVHNAGELVVKMSRRVLNMDFALELSVTMLPWLVAAVIGGCIHGGICLISAILVALMNPIFLGVTVWCIGTLISMVGSAMN